MSDSVPRFVQHTLTVRYVADESKDGSVPPLSEAIGEAIGKSGYAIVETGLNTIQSRVGGETLLTEVRTTFELCAPGGPRFCSVGPAFHNEIPPVVTKDEPAGS